MNLFPKWAEHLRLGECEIKGFDFLPHDETKKYQECVEFIKKDPLSKGALVTTHKIDIYLSCVDQFDYLDEHAKSMGEISCISKDGNKLLGHAKDPISSDLALNRILPEDYWKEKGGEVLCLGAGGAAIAILYNLNRQTQYKNHPSKIIVTDIKKSRLESIKQIFRQFDKNVPLELHQCSEAKNNDDLSKYLKPHSLIINATGLGKDKPGSPFTWNVQYPQNCIVWELNYRGELIFLDQAEAHRNKKNLTIHDGWDYFIHGWFEVIAEVFELNIKNRGDYFESLSEIAWSIRK
tara:strand:- start:73 stop:951 length:879 start_codon:yes stop_codon:yes gene_type:complete